MPRPNLLSLFDQFTRYRGDLAAVQRRGYRRESWTYGELATTAFGLARDLKQRGIRTGDRLSEQTHPRHRRRYPESGGFGRQVQGSPSLCDIQRWRPFCRADASIL